MVNSETKQVTLSTVVRKLEMVMTGFMSEYLDLI